MNSPKVGTPGGIQYSPWLRQLSDGSSYPVPVGCVWRISLITPDGKRRHFNAPSDRLAWDVTEQAFRAHFRSLRGRYLLRAITPQRRLYDGLPLAFYDLGGAWRAR